MCDDTLLTLAIAIAAVGVIVYIAALKAKCDYYEEFVYYVEKFRNDPAMLDKLFTIHKALQGDLKK